MPSDAVSLQSAPKAGAAVSVIVTELLQILELNASLPETPMPDESGVAAPDVGDRAEGVSSYGVGLGKRGFADYTKAAIPQALKDIVEAPPPPTMIGSTTWQKLAEEQAGAAKNASADMRAIEREVQDSKAEVAKWEKIGNLFQRAMMDNTGVDLREFGMEMIPADKLDDSLGKLQKDSSAASLRLQKAQEKLAMTPDRAAAVLRLIDDPRNNPERKQVTQALKLFEETNKKFGGNPKELAKAQFNDLVQIQKVLAAWNDRRAREDLPPSAEAIALGDLVQKLQREAIKGIVDQNDELPLPVGLDEKQATQARKAWKNLVASGDGDKWQSGEGNRISIPVPKPGQALKDKFGLPSTKKIDASQTAQFRMDMLSNFAMLLQTDAGRSIVNQLNEGTHSVRILPGEEPNQSNDDIYSHKTKGKGTSSAVLIPPGGKDSDVMLGTKGGNVLTAPQFIVMGHELIHALHSSRGVSRKDDDPNKIPDAETKKWKAGGIDNNAQWTDMEEYRTIFKGKLSEQTLRAQFGLSAERYGHASPKTGDSVKQAFEGAIKNYETVDQADPRLVDQKILDRKLDPTEFTDRQKLALLESDAAGPLPDGWPASQLSPAQIKAVVAKGLDHKAFQYLGWSPFDLDDKTIVCYVEHEAFPQRSPAGLTYRALGSDQAFAAIDSFSKATRTAMPSAPSGELAAPFAGVCTQQKLGVLLQAREILGKFLDEARDELDPAMRSEALAPGKLPKRLKLAQGAYTIAASGVTRSFESTNLDARVKDAKVNEKEAVQFMLAAMKRVGERLKLNEQGYAEGADIDGAILQARLAVSACQLAKAGPLSNNRETENRKAICTDFGTYLQSLENRIKAVRLRATAALEGILRSKGYMASHVKTLEALLATPLIDPRLRQRIDNTLRDAKVWVAKGQM